jgi:multidrug efflux pump subunit AcrB
VVKQTGVTVKAASPSILVAYGFYSDTDASGDPLYDPLFLSNFVDQNLSDEIRRVPGVGNISIIGERRYAMRIWLDPIKLALQNQNIQTGAGRLGQQPSPEGQEVTIPLKAESRFRDVADAENLIIKRGTEGTLVKLNDVGRVELGAENYDVDTTQSGKPSAALFVY